MSKSANDRNRIESPSLSRYHKHLDASIDWLVTSIAEGDQGSRAFVWASGKWANPYPETTGYIIPTLLNFADFRVSDLHRKKAYALGEWLYRIQDSGGYWHGGTYPPKEANPSVFNTGQILQGLCALYRDSRDSKWLDSAYKAALWLADGVSDDGIWSKGNYNDGYNPSYYSRVAWPMLEVWQLVKDDRIRESAERVLRLIKAKKQKNGIIADWGFKSGKPAFTHTIAYTLRGFIESAVLLNDWQSWGSVTEVAIEKLVSKAELNCGRMPGAFDDNWQSKSKYVCLTGNAQLAICFLKFYEREGDLRLVNAASKLLDVVCRSQSVSHPLKAFRGAIAGSSPLWGRYMTMRYPNWAAKFHGDALMLIIRILEREGLK